jgi:hypothetical protein
MKRILQVLGSTAFGAAGLVAAMAPPVHAAARAAPIADSITVTVEPTTIDLALGESRGVSVTVTNASDLASVPLVVHLDITNPDSTSSVDPEDWTSELTQPVGVVGAGSSVTVGWNLQPISPGTFTAFVVALPRDGSDVVASDVVRIQVADRRSLDPGGILPVAIGAPAVVGGLLLVQIRIARRSRRGDAPPPV